MAEVVVEALRPLVGVTLSKPEWRARARVLLGSDEALWRLQVQDLLPALVRSPEVVGFSAIGSFGVHLTVFLAQHLVAVRLAPGVSEAEELPDFPYLVRGLFETPAVSP